MVYVAAAAIVLGAVACAPANAEPESYPHQQAVYGAARGHGMLSTPTPSPTATPQPTATPAPEYSNACQAAAAAYPWDLDEAFYIIYRESGGDPWAVNASSGACGCFQMLACVGLGDPEANAAAAYQKWLDGGGSFYKHWYRWW